MGEDRDLILEAEQVLDFLNGKANKNYRFRNPNGRLTSNAEIVINRLKEGYTIQDCKTIIARKIHEWGTDDNMYKFIRPLTLFRRSNFETYYGECV